MSISYLRINLPILLVLLFVSLVSGFAQSTAATLSGTVTDERDAVVAGATVTVSNTATGFQRIVTTNESGSFSVPLLPPSTYQVTVERTGFAPFEVPNLVLNVNDVRSLKINLKVGNVGATVQVEADANAVDESPATSTTVDRTFVQNLPLNGRSLQTLINLAPGVVTTGASSQNPGQFSVNGQRASSNYFTVDGVSANFGTNNFASYNSSLAGSAPATNLQGSFSNLASIDALQEFTIQTSTFAPEFGRSPGAQVSLVTRSGEKKFHGSLYEYFRNDAFDANDFFNNLNRFKKPALRYNNFGGTFSGPVVNPGFGEGSKHFQKLKNTFFFFSYEGQRFLLPQSAINTVVPSVAARQNAPNDVARQILNAFPLPNGANLLSPAGVPTGGAYFTTTYSEPSKADAYSIRLDHNFNQKYTVFGRYNRSPASADSRSTQDLSQLNRLGTLTEFITIGSSQVFTSKIVNEIRINDSRQIGSTQNIFDGFGGGQSVPDSIIFPSNILGGTRRGIFTVNGLDPSNSTFTSYSVGTSEETKQNQWNIVDNLTWLVGNHQLKLGFDYRRLTPVLAPAEFVDNVTFNNVQSVYNNVADRVITIHGFGYTLKIPTYSSYVQDTWKATKRLTLTYGTRWEINPAPTPEGDRAYAVVTEVRDLNAVDFSYLQLAPRGTPPYKTKYTNFAPRFGAAYRLRDKAGSELVVRGGIGIFYDLGQAGFGSSLGFPYSGLGIIPNVIVPLPDTVGIFPALNFTPSPTNRASAVAVAPNYTLPRVYQWNLTAEQSLGKNQTITASYVAALGRKLIRTYNYSFAAAPSTTNPNLQFSPNFSALTVKTNGSSSDYHALQLQFNRRLTRGLQTLVSYTWSHSIDTGSTDFDGAIPGRLADPNIDRGNSDFDVRHSVSGAFTYNVPKQNFGEIGDAILGGWSLNGIFYARSALPFNVYESSSFNTSLFNARYNRRPNLVSGVPVFIEDASVPGGKRVNPAAFSFPAANQAQGSLGRNALRGFGAWQVDMGLSRRFALGERAGLQFRWEVFNIFNHTNFANPGSPFSSVNLTFPSNTPGAIAIDSPRLRSSQTLGRGLGGGSNSGGYNPLFQIGGPRSMQFALRFEF